MLSVIAFYERRLALAVTRAEASEASAAARGDGEGIAKATQMRGVLARARGRSDLALALAEQALAWAREAGRPDLEVPLLGNLAIALKDLGQSARAVQVQRDALKLRRMTGDKEVALALHNLGTLMSEQGRLREAAAVIEESILEHRARADVRGELLSRMALASILTELGVVGEATSIMEGLEDDLRQLGGRYLAGQRWLLQGDLALLAGDELVAERALSAAARAGIQDGGVEGAYRAAMPLIDLYLYGGRLGAARALLAQVADLDVGLTWVSFARELRSQRALLAALSGDASGALEAWASIGPAAREAHDIYLGRILAREARLFRALGGYARAEAALDELDALIRAFEAEGTLRSLHRRASEPLRAQP